MDRSVYEEWFELENDHWWFVGRRRIFVDIIEQILRDHPPPPGEPFRMADMGCGTGVNLDALSRFSRVIGVDVSETALSFCKERKDYLLCQAPMSGLPFRSGSIHMVTAFDVLEHGEDDGAMLAEAYRVCAPGGWGLFAVPAYHFMWGEHDVAAHHYRRYSAGEIRRRIEQSGFILHRMTYLNTFLFPVSVVFRHAKGLLTALLRRAGVERRVKSDFRSTAPPWLNPALLWIFSAERHLLRRHNLPFGLSLCCIVRKT